MVDDAMPNDCDSNSSLDPTGEPEAIRIVPSEMSLAPGQALALKVEQQMPGATPEQQQQQIAQQQQLMAQLQANPMLLAVRMQAFDLSRARAVWGSAAGDFYVATGEGRVVHVVGDQATIAYDAACADPASAGMNPICQALQAKQ